MILEIGLFWDTKVTEKKRVVEKFHIIPLSMYWLVYTLAMYLLVTRGDALLMFLVVIFTLDFFVRDYCFAKRTRKIIDSWEGPISKK